MKRLTKLLSKTLIIAAGFSALNATADVLQDIKDRNLIRIAVPQDFPPFGSIGTNLKPQGIDVDMANYIADEMGVKIEIIPVTSANRIPYLQTKKVDLVISSLGKNPEREKAIDFSTPYAPFFLGVFGSKDVSVNKIEELANKTVGVTRGSVEDLELEKNAPKSVNVRRFEDNNTTLTAYLSGQVNLIATGNLVAAEIAKRQPKRAPENKFMLKNSPCYIGMAKGETALQAKVNELIKAALASGELNEISMKWLKAPLPKGFGA
ncbi:amino acid ABC transporter substrate-binding protein [Marinomonas sp. CT5]|uniref:transporter substrate-binding domain-containing protein n=1 Tax=Marinomonas sp. CT5 TaxID=2066133 RepID=UPI0018438679|nr:transporter substrate-binding domain-containing protein [Marinomonas sp. CT5]NVK27386.1 transporter substrate-binding domain-containing protein [Flavobacteriia bacterium]QUX94211.1 amino acid ABC transporter substrate-binding protein [Marinomonas sp. CT5]